MRLIAKATAYYLATSILALGVGGVVAYNLIESEIQKETEYELFGSLERIEERIDRLLSRDMELDRMNSDQLLVQETIGPESEAQFSDTLAMHPRLERLERMRKLSTVREVQGRFFRIELIDVLVEDSDIYESVVRIMSWLFVILAIALVISGFFISRHLFNPFRKTLLEIRNFQIGNTEPIKLPKTNTKEFNTLNHFVADMTDRAQNEYQTLKKFSENASHEIQTPLAIAQGKLEILTDDSNLSPEQFQLIQSTQNALKKLSKVQQGLGLLTKIENREFSVPERINLSDLVNESLTNFKELYDLRELSVEADVAENVEVRLNKHLGDVLLNNLMQNAIRHNVDEGYIKVNLNNRRLDIRNSGPQPSKDPKLMFERFEKNGHDQSTGLGLAIVKEICDYHNFDVSYVYDIDHHLSIDFNNY